MFGKLFGQKPARSPDHPYLDDLRFEDINRVCQIIEETDEDDATDAYETLNARGVSDMFALHYQNEIVGVTGWSETEAEADSMWLSWTYVTDTARNIELDRFLMEELLKQLNNEKVRKLFIDLSDYKEDGVDIYAAQRKLYTDFGAKLELTLPAFYSATESKMIYGLENPGMGKEEDLSELGNRGVSFHAIDADEESTDIGLIHWDETEDGVSGLETVMGQARSRGFRRCAVALPADISDVAKPELEDNGFERHGMLSDYYAIGLGQVWWTKPLN